MATGKVEIVDPGKGKPLEIVVHLASPQDVTGWEHERDHRGLVASILGVPTESLEGLGITVLRQAATEAAPAPSPTEADRRGGRSPQAGSVRGNPSSHKGGGKFASKLKRFLQGK